MITTCDKLGFLPSPIQFDQICTFYDNLITFSVHLVNTLGAELVFLDLLADKLGYHRQMESTSGKVIKTGWC